LPGLVGPRHMGVWESSPWKAQLQRNADILERWANRPSHSSKRDFLVESKIVQSAFAIRKLIETNKISTVLTQANIKCIKYPRNASKITPANNHHIQRHFNFNSPVSHSLSLRYLINQIIHSLILMFAAEDRGPITHFLTVSDRDSKNSIYEVPLIDFIILVRRLSKDFPSTFVWFIDEDDTIHTWIGDGAPPGDFLRRMSKNRATAIRKSGA
jgi:hypothetical protein